MKNSILIVLGLVALAGVWRTVEWAQCKSSCGGGQAMGPFGASLARLEEKMCNEHCDSQALKAPF